MYLVYRTTNKITQEYYIGVHKVNPSYPYYLGSGLRLKRSLKKYGRENFVRETLFEFEGSSEAFEKEKEVLKEHLSDAKCLNLAEGGSNFLGKKHTEETKKRIAQWATGKKHKKKQSTIDKARENRYKRNGGKWFSPETIEKIREKAKLRKSKPDKADRTNR